MEELYKQLLEKQANLWTWDGKNPYENHPLKVVGLDDKPKVTAPMVKKAVEQSASRRKQNTSELKATDDPILMQKSQDLLLDPYTRVFCELMRIPPVEIPKEDLDQVKSEAAKEFKILEELPCPTEMECNWLIIAQEILTELFEEQVKIPEIVVPELTDSDNMQLKRNSLVSFRRRDFKQKQGDKNE